MIKDAHVIPLLDRKAFACLGGRDSHACLTALLVLTATAPRAYSPSLITCSKLGGSSVLCLFGGLGRTGKEALGDSSVDDALRKAQAHAHCKKVLLMFRMRGQTVCHPADIRPPVIHPGIRSLVKLRAHDQEITHSNPVGACDHMDMMSLSVMDCRVLECSALA